MTTEIEKTRQVKHTRVNKHIKTAMNAAVDLVNAIDVDIYQAYLPDINLEYEVDYFYGRIKEYKRRKRLATSKFQEMERLYAACSSIGSASEISKHLMTPLNINWDRDDSKWDTILRIVFHEYSRSVRFTRLLNRQYDDLALYFSLLTQRLLQMNKEGVHAFPIDVVKEYEQTPRIINLETENSHL